MRPLEEPVGIESEIHLFGIYRIFIYGSHSISFREKKVASLFRVEMVLEASSGHPESYYGFSMSHRACLWKMADNGEETRVEMRNVLSLISYMKFEY